MVTGFDRLLTDVRGACCGLRMEGEVGSVHEGHSSYSVGGVE